VPKEDAPSCDSRRVKTQARGNIPSLKELLYKWKETTVELATELWIAREVLSAQELLFRS